MAAYLLVLVSVLLQLVFNFTGTWNKSEKKNIVFVGITVQNVVLSVITLTQLLPRCSLKHGAGAVAACCH